MSKKDKASKVLFNSKFSCSPTAKNEEQKEVIRSLLNNQITIISGCAGTGKTYLATMWGLNEFLQGRFKRLIFTRPAVEAYGERLGFLPGGADDKIAPYMLPIVNFVIQKISVDFFESLIKEKKILTIPLAYQRGLTFEDSFVIFDEAQNCIPQQMRLFLTRIGETSKVVVTGDIHQSDIGYKNGLEDAMNRLNGVKGIGICKLSMNSVFRSEIVKRIEDKYQELNSSIK